MQSNVTIFQLKQLSTQKTTCFFLRIIKLRSLASHAFGTVQSVVQGLKNKSHSTELKLGTYLHNKIKIRT